ncbi:SusC/RagA family TonB-linked outer membrane protein [Subsaximicrobium wynnwilliamsii]|uniref:SusC/RagA family TonB-linked outer membrane protein n=1 Tax=Subsaximicrobium wynnwilliamsii TaxID=291179 RepID=A0A5C6ZBY5_9FLAO|nr:SusC/RagA family TonB-linked outer membrane protein [Subsaximicrobium wynnwilliamsii]TXD81182.1 SusC/RagA family TonB-linked outer membrane protein [Subsaximicrobium wynnwilliamsii]TXD86999.1 SusC/RagA family TonB-linked outer membrane protein [Subsaximicrobium wynnwilliamsii]TXE00652.1 SusC/RagA family TonB-linked outer membrane protein [Subsaximicrobium wynnwilliamsii]
MQLKLTNTLFFQWKEISKFIVKTLLLLCCTTVFSLSSSAIFSQNEKVVIDSDKTMTIYEVLELIGKQTECTFIYQSDIFKDVPDIAIRKGVIKVMKLLQQCLPETEFKITTTKDSYITIIRKAPNPPRQVQIQIKGIITGVEGLPIPGVYISIDGSTNYTTSDFDGSFSLVESSNETLKFSLLGYQTQFVKLDGRTTINVTLIEDVTALDVVTLNAGYYSVKEKEATGNISKIEQKDIENQPVTNPLAAIQGRVAGVEITQTSGLPGAGFEIKIRGQNSIRANGNDPLYIIDGVPYASSTIGDVQTSLIIPGFGISPLNNINSDDIQSIEILKDADATAIYGSRGANGVVLITTKKGKFGATEFNIATTSGFGSIANRIDLLGTPEYLAMRREAYENEGIDPLPFNAYDINGTWDENRYTNWQKELIGKTARLENVQASFSSGNAQTRFLISGNYNKQTNVFPGDFSNRQMSVLSSINHKSKNEKLALQFSANFSSNNNDLPATSLVREALLLAPNAPTLYNEDGSLNWEDSTWNNPLRNLEGKYGSNSTNLISNLTIDYELFKDFKFITSLGYTQNNLSEIRTVPSTIFNPAFGLGPEISSAIHNDANRKSWIIEPQLHHNFKIFDTDVQTLVGLTFQEESSHQLSQIASGFTNNVLIENLAAASQLFVLADNPIEYRYNAFFGRVNLNHKQKYILNLTGRRDGSSRFGPNKQFANFGAVGAAWIFSNEDFIKETFPILSYGKIRGSYGTSGNDQIGNYEYLNTFSFGNTFYQNTIGLQPTRLFNPDFSWEENRKLEIAVELGLFKDVVLLSSSYYRNRSSNQLIGVPLPATTGFNSINANLDATVENRGLEFQLTSQNIKTEHFSWSSSVNLTIPKNELLSFPDLEGSSYANQLVIGQPLNIVKVYESQGVNPQTGLFEFTDFNNDGNISSPQDRQIVKDLNPEYYGGFENSLSYKNLSLNVLFQFTKQLGAHYLAGGNFIGAMSNQPVEVLDRWQNIGDVTDVQQFTTGLDPESALAFINYTQSDAGITDASYIRLKTVALSYQLPTIRQRVNCEVFLRGQNLLTLTKYNGLDPETRSRNTIPPLRFITLGTKFTFK